MKALVLETVGRLSLREIEISEPLGPDDVEIALRAVGICGSDVHYYTHGAIGPFVVTAPMVLGHEASGRITAAGRNVRHLRVGDRVCMEPGIPTPTSRAVSLGMYNLDPGVRFWATPPHHGCLRPTVVHPAAFTFRLPETVSFNEGAMVEPLAIGMHAAAKTRIRPGDLAVVIGAGTIGIVTALAALAGGCSRIILADIRDAKLAIARQFPNIITVNSGAESLPDRVREITDGWGADIVFEASGAPEVANTIFSLLCIGGRVVYIGMPPGPITIDIVSAQTREASVETIFRYANDFPRALALMGSGKIDLKPLITDVYPFEKSIEAVEYAAHMGPRSVKVMVTFPEGA
jgi:D-xylulose reductase